MQYTTVSMDWARYNNCHGQWLHINGINAARVGRLQNSSLFSIVWENVHYPKAIKVLLLTFIIYRYVGMWNLYSQKSCIITQRMLTSSIQISQDWQPLSLYFAIALSVAISPKNNDFISSTCHSNVQLNCRVVARHQIPSDIFRVLQAGKWNFERGQKRSKMTFLGLKIIIFGHFSRFLAFFKISFSSLQHPNHSSFTFNHFYWGLFTKIIRNNRETPYLTLNNLIVMWHSSQLWPSVSINPAWIGWRHRY